MISDLSSLLTMTDQSNANPFGGKQNVGEEGNSISTVSSQQRLHEAIRKIQEQRQRQLQAGNPTNSGTAVSNLLLGSNGESGTDTDTGSDTGTSNPAPAPAPAATMMYLLAAAGSTNSTARSVALNTDQLSANITDQPGPHDVLLGRGGETNNHR